MPRQPQQQTLFDETMRQHAEQAMWHAEDLQQQLREVAYAKECLRQEVGALQAKVERLEQEKRSLEFRVTVLQGQLFTATISRPVSDDRPTLARELTKLAAQVHPDRHSGSEIAEEVTKQVLALRDRLTH